MAKKGRCCLVSLILIVVFLGGIFAAGYFGGNYFLKKYLGDQGELYRLNINNWGDLFDFLSGAKDLLSTTPEIEEANKPTDQNLTAAKNQLESAIIGYDAQTQFFDNDQVVFKAPLRLTGGQLAALVRERLASQEQSSQEQFDIAQIQLEVDPQTKSYCLTTMTMVIKKESIEKPLKESLGFLGGVIVDSMSDVYVTNTCKLIADAQNPGKVLIDKEESPDLYFGKKGENKINEQMVDVIIALFGAENKSELNEMLCSAIVEAINQVGKVSFDYDQGISYLVFDNAYNNELIYQLADIVELDISQFDDLSSEDIDALTQIKDDVNNLLAILASTQYDDDTTPQQTQVQSAVSNVKTEFDNYMEAYKSNPASTDLTDLQTAVDDLKTLLD